MCTLVTLLHGCCGNGSKYETRQSVAPEGRRRKANERVRRTAVGSGTPESAQRSMACVRPYDSVGRYGGEEFLIVVPSSDAMGTMGLADAALYRAKERGRNRTELARPEDLVVRATDFPYSVEQKTNTR